MKSVTSRSRGHSCLGTRENVRLSIKTSTRTQLGQSVHCKAFLPPRATNCNLDRISTGTISALAGALHNRVGHCSARDHEQRRSPLLPHPAIDVFCYILNKIFHGLVFIYGSAPPDQRSSRGGQASWPLFTFARQPVNSAIIVYPKQT
jgi:hypothetical protein